MSNFTLLLFALLAVATITVGDIVLNEAKYRFSLQRPDGIGWLPYWKLLLASEHGSRAKVGLVMFLVGMALLLAFVIAVLAKIQHNPHFLNFI